jgi:hypothetical protein
MYLGQGPGRTVKVPTGRRVVDRHGHVFAEYEFFEYVEPGGGLGDLGRRRKKRGGFFRSIGRFFEQTGKAIGRVVVPVAGAALRIVGGAAAGLVPGAARQAEAPAPELSPEYFQPAGPAAAAAPAGGGPFGLPGWVFPAVVIGGLGVGAIALLRPAPAPAPERGF